VQKGAVFYGRYWGSSHKRPFLHFEACYYTPIQLAIEVRAAAASPHVAQPRPHVAQPRLSTRRPEAPWDGHACAHSQCPAARHTSAPHTSARRCAARLGTG
jgi:hypothetical protein